MVLLPCVPKTRSIPTGIAALAGRKVTHNRKEPCDTSTLPVTREAAVQLPGRCPAPV